MKLAESFNKIGDSRFQINTINLSSKTGGGALPLLELPSKCLRLKIKGMSANMLEKNMRENTPPIIGRIEGDEFIIDPRTLQDDDFPVIQSAFENLLKRVRP